MSKLSIQGLQYKIKDRLLFNVNLELILQSTFHCLVIRGPSGSGKTTLLKCISNLIPFESGSITLDGKASSFYGIANWRLHFLYVPQKTPSMDGTPNNLIEKQRLFASMKNRTCGDAVSIGLQWSLPISIWETPWRQLSGGEAQRALLAIAVSLNPVFLLLDEPTSALDAETARLVEDTLKEMCNCIWVTHDDVQSARVATQVLNIGRDALDDEENGEFQETHFLLNTE